MAYEKIDLLHEGKAKKVFSTNDPDVYIQEFKDDATAFDGTKKGQILSKGVVNNAVASAAFIYLEKQGVPTHFVESLSEREMAIKPLKIFLVEVVIRNVCAGSITRRLPFEKGQLLPEPLLELFYKNDDYHDPLIIDEHVFLLDLATPEQLADIKTRAYEINRLLQAFFDRLGFRLIDFKLEFGLDREGNILLGDEISPDTCRLWDKETGDSFDKDRFRFDMGGVEQSYQAVLKRLTENV